MKIFLYLLPLTLFCQTYMIKDRSNDYTLYDESKVSITNQLIIKLKSNDYAYFETKYSLKMVTAFERTNTYIFDNLSLKPTLKIAEEITVEDEARIIYVTPVRKGGKALK